MCVFVRVYVCGVCVCMGYFEGKDHSVDMGNT